MFSEIFFYGCEDRFAGEVECEIPLKFIREAVRNAVANRNYVSHARGPDKKAERHENS